MLLHSWAAAAPIGPQIADKVPGRVTVGLSSVKDSVRTSAMPSSSARLKDRPILLIPATMNMEFVAMLRPMTRARLSALRNSASDAGSRRRPGPYNGRKPVPGLRFL